MSRLSSENVLESKPQILMLVTCRDFSVADSARAGFIETLLQREKHALQLPPLSVGEIAAMLPAYRFTEYSTRDECSLGLGKSI